MTQPKRFNLKLYGAAGDYSNCLPYLSVFSFAFTSVTWLYFFSFSLACFFFLHLFLTFLSLSLLSPLIKSFLLTYFLLSFSFYFQSTLMIAQFNKLHKKRWVFIFFELESNDRKTGLQRNKRFFSENKQSSQKFCRSLKEWRGEVSKSLLAYTDDRVRLTYKCINVHLI